MDIREKPAHKYGVPQIGLCFRNVFILLGAFDLSTWAFILTSLLVVPVVLAVVASAEGVATGRQLPYRRPLVAGWFSFGVFLGESMNFNPGERSHATR